jgi:hypothetical protein
MTGGLAPLAPSAIPVDDLVFTEQGARRFPVLR